MEFSAKNEGHSGDVSHSQAAVGQDAGNESSDNGHANSGLELREGELKTAVSIAAAQFGQDLHAVGSELLNIESRHRGLMERLQRIAEQVDERATRQFETLREEVTGAQRQNVGLREDLEVFRASFPEQLALIGSQCAKLDQQLHSTEQRLEGLEDLLRDTLHKIQVAEGQHDAVQQRLQPAEQKILEAEQSWQRADAQFQAAELTFKKIEQQICVADERIQTSENNHNIVQQLLQATEQKILAAENKHDALQQLVQGAEQRIQTAASKHSALEQMLHTAEQRIQAAEARHNALQELLQGAEQRIQTAEGRHSAMEQMLQAAGQRLQEAETKRDAMQQMLQAAEQKILETGNKLADVDRENMAFATQMKTRAERLTAEWDEIKRIFNEQARRRENIEVSIGELGKDVGELKGQFSELLAGPFEKLKSIQVTMKTYRRILLIAVAAFILTLLAVGYVQVGKPGWRVFAPYLSQ